jgi:hypothetical protein
MKCGYCKDRINGNDWVLIDNENVKVCQPCWKVYLKELQEEEDLGRHNRVYDDHYHDKMANLDRFVNWLGIEVQEQLQPVVDGKISCDTCGGSQDLKHYCFGGLYQENRHTLKGKDLCHLCWDKYCEESVQMAGY